MKEKRINNIGKIALIISIIGIIISLSGIHITIEKGNLVNKVVEIDFTGWGFVDCPSKSCVKINYGFDKEGIHCNVPIIECPKGEYMVEDYSICYDIHYHRNNNVYLTFNVNHNYGFVDSCVIPVYKRQITLKRNGA